MKTIGKCRVLSKECNKFTYEFTFTNLHSQRTNTISGFFIQSMIKKNEYHISFVLIDTSMHHPKMWFNFLPSHVEIMTSTNQGVLLCHAYNGPCYYMCNHNTKQWKRISNSQTRYDIMEFDMMVKRSKPLHYKIVRFLKLKFCPHDKELYMYHYIRAELFDSKNWR
jgi:hypothetical protein